MRAERFGVISIYDPAIDTARVPLPVWRDYAQTRNIALLEPYIRAGRRPTVFHIRELPRRVLSRYVKSAGSESLELERAFMCGVESADNLEQSDGSYINYTPTRELGSEAMQEESLDRFCGGDVEEIGEVIRQHSDFRLSIDRCFHLRPSLAERWGAFHARHVDASQSSQASSSDAASSGEASPASDTARTAKKSAPNASDSGGPTDATATESAP